jgi:HD-GYP domain-containing protein (c-di-GMP phosphodiesterase class II)
MELLDIVAAEATAINSALASITGKKIRDFSNAEAKLKKVHESIQDRRSDPGSESTPEYASDVLQASLYEEVLREVSPTMRKTKKKKEVKESTVTKSKKLAILMEQDLDQAEVVLAAKAMIDKLQGMAEDLAEMSVEELMPIVDAMKASFGIDMANQFSANAESILAPALDVVKQARDGMDNAVLGLTGEGPSPDMAMAPGPEMGMEPVGEPGMDIMPGEDEFAGADVAAGAMDEPTGRIPKESLEKVGRYMFEHKMDNGKVPVEAIKKAAVYLAKQSGRK